MAILPIDEIRTTLYKATNAKELKRLQDDFYHWLDARDDLFEQGFELFLEILRTKLLFSKYGINKFIAKYSLQYFELKTSQQAQLLNTICDHFADYNQNVCFSLCQIIIDITDITSTTLPFLNKLYVVTSNQGKAAIYDTCWSLIIANEEIADSLRQQIKAFIPEFRY